MYKIYLLTVGLLIVGCERSGLSPVEIKIEEDTEAVSVETPVQSATHRVSGNETLFDIANKYNIDPMNLARINGIRPPYRVKNGQVIRLPEERLPMEEKIEDKMPQYEQSQEEDKKKSELDDEFAGIMSKKNSVDSSMGAGTSFNDQATLLSTPKITKTATGTVTKSSKPIKDAPLKSRSSMRSTGKLLYPVKGKIISIFGGDMDDGVSNDGINIQAPLGTPVKAAADGTVIYAGNKMDTAFGNIVIIQHEDGLITSYAHLDSIKTKNDKKVSAGDIIGLTGKTGDVTISQLHFEVMKDKTPVNPIKYLQQY